MLAIRDGCSRLLSRQVHLAELFDLGEEAPVVARWQGELFAEEWFRGSIVEACGATEIMPWPEDDDSAQIRFHDITEEVCARTFEAVRQTISDAFVSVANDVLNRERSR